jgi:putative tryptophan/tyrosine transport system substrate-binding protein
LVGALLQSLALSGWIIDRNIHIETRYATGNVVEIRKHAAELVALAPDIIVAHGGAAVSALLQATRTIPIVFPVVSDPVGAGLVDSLARPGGNATGFLILEYDLSGKWLELLKQIAPNVTRAAVIRDTARPSGIGEYGARVCSSIVQNGVNPDQPARPRGNGTRHRHIRARFERRVDRDDERISA